jgi:AcrR family transcriptional regulator
MMQATGRVVKKERSFYIVGDMPRVSQEHLDARRRQILEAARSCFVREGFHATSMQDILSEADLSAGALYRYFKSKDDIVLAIAEQSIGGLIAIFERSSEEEAPPPLDEVVRDAFALVDGLGERGMLRLGIQIWAEALRSPRIAESLRGAYAELRAGMKRLVAAYQQEGRIAEAASAEEVAKVIVALVPGYVLQHAILGDVDAESFSRGLRALLASEAARPARSPAGR